MLKLARLIHVNFVQTFSSCIARKFIIDKNNICEHLKTNKLNYIFLFSALRRNVREEAIVFTVFCLRAIKFAFIPSWSLQLGLILKMSKVRPMQIMSLTDKLLWIC